MFSKLKYLSDNLKNRAIMQIIDKTFWEVLHEGYILFTLILGFNSENFLKLCFIF